jgi:hypothetical protein
MSSPYERSMMGGSMSGSFTCERCGRKLSVNLEHEPGICRECAVPAAQVAVSPARALPVRDARSDGVQSTAPLTLVGFLFVAIGLYFLVLEPGAATGDYTGLVPSRVVNLQRLAMGETFTICGAVFLAAAWRPR